MSAEEKRNPGPAGGYHLIVFFRKALPEFIFSILVGIGSLIAVLCMGRQRRASRDYLSLVLQRTPSFSDVWRHFDTFARTLVFRLEVGATRNPKLKPPQWEGEAFMALARSGTPALYGSFHIGCSDLMGYALSEGFCKVYMVRLKVGNSHDTERFRKAYHGVHMLWTNHPDELTIGIHRAVGEGASLAMLCDRPEFSSRSAEFDFLGQRVEFPVTIYHLSALYRMPVSFCFCIFTGSCVETFATEIFHPEGGRREVLAAGHRHFQRVLGRVESLLEEYPYQWFNFEALPAAREGSAAEPEGVAACR